MRKAAPEQVRDALAQTVQTVPSHLKRSLTWDQGSEMAAHKSFTLATDINGLLRQYFPKGTDLAVHGSEHLTAVAAQLNGRPRKTLGWETPAERLHKLLAA